MPRPALPGTSEEASVVSHAQPAVPKGFAMVLRGQLLKDHIMAVRQHQQGLHWQCIRMLSNPTAGRSWTASTRKKLCRNCQT